MKRKISLKLAQDAFNSMALSQAQTEKYASPELERTRYWNWFRAGMMFGRHGKVSASHTAWLRSSPHVQTQDEVKPTIRIPFPSVDAELAAIDAKAAAWLVQARKRRRERWRLVALAHQANKFTADARAKQSSERP